MIFFQYLPFATPLIIFMPHCAKLWWSRQLVIEPVIHSITYEFLVVGNLLLCSEQKWRFAPSSKLRLARRCATFT